MPLQYMIQNLHQLSQCLSNQSRDLRISVTDFVQDPRLQGMRIQVVHEQLGVLFACVIHSSGTLLKPNIDESMNELTWDDINKELDKFGFCVFYRPEQKLSPEQLAFLINIHRLGMDRIRPIGIKDTHSGYEIVHTQIVAFQADRHPKWLDIHYSPSEKEYVKAISDGSAINIRVLSIENKFSWTWLDYVGDIGHILEGNGEVLVCPST